MGAGSARGHGEIFLMEARGVSTAVLVASALSAQLSWGTPEAF